jgi:beta-galactosidase
MNLKLSPYTSIIVLIFLFFSCNKANDKQTSVERTISFNKDWQFHLEDSLVKNPSEFSWQKLNLPHDWSIEGDFDENHPATYNGGALPGGIGWYKKIFKVEVSDKLKELYIDFDGVYMDSEVWINNHYLGKRPNGYIGFRYNLTPFLNYGEKENEIKVKVDNSQQPNSRWYSGSGIYRNVWLVKTDKLHIKNWGTYVTTPMVTLDSATVNVETSITNNYTEAKNIVLKTTVLFNNEKITENSNHLNIKNKNELTFSEKLEINSPKLWSIETPQLYTILSKVYIDNELVDTYKTPIGIRFFKFDLDKGFLLNNKSVKIKGVCNHHDLGALGTAINTRALERQLEILKGMGVNGIRTAHNPPAPELLDLCDKMGFIVMNEAFDMWNNSKTTYDYANNWKEWHKKDLEDFVKRDRNHPSVFIWSIGNEIQEQWNEQGVETAKELKAIVTNLDTTRLITAGMNPPVNMVNQDVTLQFDKANVNYNALAASGVLDIIGYNYAHQTYVHHKQNFPETPFIATETTSGLQTRGYYDQKSDTLKRWPVRWDVAFTGGNPDNTISSYDQVSAPWGSTHEETWKVIKKHDFLSGMFIWTGFDYLGEPTPYVWPSRSSYFGVIDLAGFPKDVYYMYQSEWTDKPVLHVFPHWNWEKDQDVDIWAYYNNADEVELFLNGKSLGSKHKKGDDLHLMWRLPFEPGTLTAVSRKNGKTVLEKEIKTAEEASQISLNADRNTIQGDGVDLSFITVSVLDKKGTLVPYATNNIEFNIEGPGKIVGVDNGDPTSHASFKASNRNAFYGKCLVIVQSLNKEGIIKLTANSKGLTDSTINISTK